MDNGKNPAMKRIKLLVVIIDRGKGEVAARLLRESGVTYNMIAPAYCASGSDIMDYLGLSNPERDMIISVITEDKAVGILSKILYKFDLDEPGNGMAFTIPITGVSGPLALRYISGVSE